MKEIKLTQDKVALADDGDFELVSKYKWHATKQCKTFYAATNIRINNRATLLKMHTLILGEKIGFQIDHINHNGLDNRQANLRHATMAQNQQNRICGLPHTSIYKGVSWHKSNGKWLAHIRHDGVAYHLGYFYSEREAALSYNKSAIERFGDFANLNNI